MTNGGETIVLGGVGMTGDYQDTFTVVEYNLWENCFGDGELISIKTSSSTIRHNTVRRSGGGFTSRAGNKSRIHDNFFLQEGRSGSGGVRIHEKDHLVYNNYVQGSTADPIQVGDGDPYDQPGFSHAQVVRAKIVHNTLVNCRGSFKIGNAHPLDPVALVVANNLLLNTGFSGPAPLPGRVYSQNMTSPNNPNRPGFLVADPLLTRVGEIFKLSERSPARDAATRLDPALQMRDIDGQRRQKPDDLSIPMK